LSGNLLMSIGSLCGCIEVLCAFDDDKVCRGVDPPCQRGSGHEHLNFTVYKQALHQTAVVLCQAGVVKAHAKLQSMPQAGVLHSKIDYNIVRITGITERLLNPKDLNIPKASLLWECQPGTFWHRKTLIRRIQLLLPSPWAAFGRFLHQRCEERPLGVHPPQHTQSHPAR